MIKRELITFLFVGSLTVLTDFLTYRALTQFQMIEVNVAKAVGFTTGTLFAYFANRFWTFGYKSHLMGSVLRFVLLYGSTLSANVLINALALSIITELSVAVQLAFLLATLVSASLNFLGMKYFVFKSIPASVVR